MAYPKSVLVFVCFLSMTKDIIFLIYLQMFCEVYPSLVLLLFCNKVALYSAHNIPDDNLQPYKIYQRQLIL